MPLERTLSMIKPDATRRNITGKIIDRFEQNDLRVVASKRIHLSRREARLFYEMHQDKPFFEELVEFMVSEPIVVQVLEGKNAVAKNREIMGATDPEKAAPGTIRKDFALSIGENSVHGSDSKESAAREIKFFFSDTEVVG